MKHNQNFQTVLSSGFEPGAMAKERVKAKLWQKINRPAPGRLRWALAVGSLLVLLGIGLYPRKPYPVELLGPNAWHAGSTYAAQHFGECGPRGLENQPNYIHFR